MRPINKSKLASSGALRLLEQEGWLSPTERASVSAIRHMLASPHLGLLLVRPWDNRGKCHMDEKWFSACKTHHSMYPSIFNRFPVIQPVSSNVRHFSSFFAHFGLPGYAPGTIAVNITWMERGFNAGQTHSSIYPYILTVYEL